MYSLQSFSLLLSLEILPKIVYDLMLEARLDRTYVEKSGVEGGPDSIGLDV